MANLRPIAISSASTTSSARRWLAIDQPTILRLQASSTTARNRNPVAVGTKVMSATQSWLAALAVKSRSTRSGAGRASRSRRVVLTPVRRRLAPTKPAVRISRAIRLRPCFSPSALSSACTRGAPVCLARTGVDRADPFQQHLVSHGVRRGRTLPPRVIARLRYAEDARHDRDWKDGLVRAHEFEDPGGIAPVSRANQAAARERMSRSSRSCLFSRHNRASSSHSAAASPLTFSSRRPPCRSA